MTELQSILRRPGGRPQPRAIEVEGAVHAIAILGHPGQPPLRAHQTPPRRGQVADLYRGPRGRSPLRTHVEGSASFSRLRSSAEQESDHHWLHSEAMKITVELRSSVAPESNHHLDVTHGATS